MIWTDTGDGIELPINEDGYLIMISKVFGFPMDDEFEVMIVNSIPLPFPQDGLVAQFTGTYGGSE